MKHDDASHAVLREARELGPEARADHDDHAALKLWLRLLATSTQVETEIRRRLRDRFGVSLGRFDYMAQLFRHPDGLRMRELSRYLMVTGGNVTGLTDELERDALVRREADPRDRRACILHLTSAGRRSFQAMADAHEQWVMEMFEGLDAKSVQQLYTRLGALRVQLVRNERAPTGPA